MSNRLEKNSPFLDICHYTCGFCISVLHLGWKPPYFRAQDFLLWSMEGRLQFQLASDLCGFKNVGKASVPRKSNVLLQREKVKMCVWVIPDAVHSAASDLLGFVFSSYLLSVVISYLHNLEFAFLQLPVPVAVAINGPTSSDAFRMGPSLWTLFAAHAQLQPSTPRLVWNGFLSSLAFGLRWWTAFVSWACHAGNLC